MGRIGAHHGEVYTGAREPAQRCQEVLGERWPVAFDELQGPSHIETVDDDTRCRGRVVNVPTPSRMRR